MPFLWESMCPLVLVEVGTQITHNSVQVFHYLLSSPGQGKLDSVMHPHPPTVSIPGFSTRQASPYEFPPMGDFCLQLWAEVGMLQGHLGGKAYQALTLAPSCPQMLVT